MAQIIQAIRGMNDILPDVSPYWSFLENTYREIVSRYGYREVRLPEVEQTELFERTIGEVTDIVEKEMYTFTDRNGDSLTLRPEGTAGCVRAGIEHGLFYNQTQRLWYMGPMFRHERPQKGRYRQFYQIGVETFGMSGPDIDAELIFMCARLWKELGINDQIELQLNSLGTRESRVKYREKLIDYFKKHADALDADSQRRLITNPLRILDSKNPDMKAVIAGAPKLMDHLDDVSKRHFEELCAILDKAGLPYVINPTLVRGLDYYGLTVFEWVTNALGAQGTVCAGGRYDDLVAQLGGRPTSAAGFAAGLERIVLLLQSVRECAYQSDLYCVLVGAEATDHGLLLAERLRTELPKLKIETNLGAGSFKSQFKRADKSGAEWALIVGDEEIKTNTVSLKNLREDKPQQQLSVDELITFLRGSQS